MVRQIDVTKRGFNLVGKVFSELTVISLHPESRKRGKSFCRQWVCACSCGKEAIVASGDLTSGGTKSCGHLNYLSRNKKFGTFREKVYAAWSHAFNRCYSDNYVYSHRYKGRGITMSEEFVNSFDKFYEHVGDPPTKEHTLERIDVNGNYERGNLMWQVKEKQARNRAMHSSNTSGFTGVNIIEYKNRTYVFARCIVWSDNNTKHTRKSKGFSVKKYGLLPAFAMACAHREQMIAELNAQGYGYTENHGK